MRQTVKNYEPIVDLTLLSDNALRPHGFSVGPRTLIFHIFDDNARSVQVLDIGFGQGLLGQEIKSHDQTKHWQIDGLDGWEPNCLNSELINGKFYRNVWHGLAQDLRAEDIKKYDLLCLLDVIEHLDVNSAKWVVRSLLTHMNDNSYLFISTPLFFATQDQFQHGDLEEHKIGIPVTSMLGLIPTIYSIGEWLVGGFVYGKKSLNYIDLFQPTTNKNFDYDMGLSVLNSCNIQGNPGVFYKTNKQY